jgi:hypothetical protein
VENSGVGENEVVWRSQAPKADLFYEFASDEIEGNPPDFVWEEASSLEDSVVYIGEEFSYWRLPMEGFRTPEWIPDFETYKGRGFYEIEEIDLDRCSLTIDPVRGRQHVNIEAGSPRVIEGQYFDFASLFNFKGTPISRSVVPIRATSQSARLPAPYERLDEEMDAYGGPRRDIIFNDPPEDEMKRNIIAWSLEPLHNTDDWRKEYRRFLELERRRRTEYFGEILRDCQEQKTRDRGGQNTQDEEEVDWNEQTCRMVKTELERHGRWMHALEEDADRVLRLLLKGEVPGFLGRMSVREALIGDAVVRGPVATISLIHRHLWSFSEGLPPHDITAFWNRLPDYLRDLYPTPKDLRRVTNIRGR